MGAHSLGLVYVFVGWPINVIQLCVRALKVLFNIAFISAAFALTFENLPLMYSLRKFIVEAIHVVVPSITVPRAAINLVVGLYSTLDSFFSDIDLAYRWRQETACGGAAKWLQLFAVVIFFGSIVFVMATDVMFALGIKAYKLTESTTNPIYKKIIEGLLDLVNGIVAYLLQVFAFIGLQMLLDGIDTKSTRDLVCSVSDADALKAARIFMIIMLIIFLITGFVIYSNVGYAMTKLKRVSNKCGCLFGFIFLAIKYMLCLTLGIWDPDTLQCYQVAGKAEEYDDNPDDDDKRQESVISILVKTRGLLWIMVPTTVFVAKVSEALNESIIFGALEYKDPLWKRIFLWILNVAEVTLTLMFVFAPSTNIALGLIAELGLRFAFSLFETIQFAVVIFRGIAEKIAEKQKKNRLRKLEKRKAANGGDPGENGGDPGENGGSNDIELNNMKNNNGNTKSDPAASLP